jgi:hypothetical protein
MRRRTCIAVPNGSGELSCRIGGDPELIGPRTGPVVSVLAPGATVAGVRFRPGAASSVLGVPASELVVDARYDFRRARRAGAAARMARRLARRRCRSGSPRTLAAGAALPARAASLEVIALRSIVGTLEPTAHFDARFRPLSEHVRARWERIALAHRTGVALPPIVVVQRVDGYYVVDGRHRVSVALALGLRDIEAWVRRGATSAMTERRPSCSQTA